MSFGALFREARLARGLSLADVGQATRIPEEHLRALEDDRPEDLPEGPYRAAYTRAVCALLEIEPPDDLPEVMLPEPRVPLWAVRLIAGSSVAMVVGLMASTSGTSAVRTWTSEAPVVT